MYCVRKKVFAVQPGAKILPGEKMHKQMVGWFLQSAEAEKADHEKVPLVRERICYLVFSEGILPPGQLRGITDER